MISMTSPSNTGPIGDSVDALHHVLSQLSFASDLPWEDIHAQDPNRFAWNGLFCLSLDEDENDLYFDAQETMGPMRPENGTSSTTPSFSGLGVRGGGTKNPGSALFEGGSSIHQDRLISTEKHDAPTYDPAEEAQAQAKVQPLSPGPFAPLPAPPPPDDLPVRFLRAGKGDPLEGQRRYHATLKWRKENGIDHILTDAHPDFDLIKKHYPHYFHLRGRNGEPVFFEQPPKTNLQAMKSGGVTLEGLLHHYAMVTEFQWQCVERDDFARSITVLDLDGMRMMDFVGECVEYVRRCSEFTGQHYPERAGFVYVVNVPVWFAMVWKVVQPWVDEVTLKKISIIRGKKEVFEALSEKIPIENIPPEYGGRSVPLGESPEEHLMRDLIHHNNCIANGDYSCGGREAHPPCRFCSFVPARSY